jgi:hypothetical protein
MITGTNEKFPIGFSLNIYRLLLAAYPKEFRQEYGADMLQVFRDCMRRAYGQNGAFGVFRLWALTLPDLAVSLVEEHLQKETKIMNKNTLIRLSGWALVLAGIGFFSITLGTYIDQNNPLMHFDNSVYYEFAYIYGVLVTPFLLAAGMLGLWARYRQSAGDLGNIMLLIGGIFGPILSLIGIIGASSSGELWLLIPFGSQISSLCLAIFGFDAIRSKPLPRLNFIPILAGIITPALFFTGLMRDEINLLGFILITAQFLSMVILGIILQGDVEQQSGEPLAAAA